MAVSELNIDACIEELLAVKDDPPGTEVALEGAKIAAIVRQSRDIFLDQVGTSE